MFSSPTTILLIALSGSPADTPKKDAVDYSGATKLTEKAVAALAKGGVSDLLDVLFADDGTALVGPRTAQLDAHFAGLAATATFNNGKVVGGYELAHTETLGESLVRTTYLEKRERGAVAWHFTLYRGEGGTWRWNGYGMTNGLMAHARPVKLDAPEFDGARALAADGVAALKAGGVAKLLDALYTPGKTAVVAPRGAVETPFVAKRAAAAAPQGKSLGEFELVRALAVGKSFVCLVYIEKHEQGVVVWQFMLDRLDGKWRWTNLDVSANADALFPLGK